MSTYKNDDINHLEESLNSLNNQTILPSELVIIFDGPVPLNLEMVVEKFSEVCRFSINVIKLKQNQGLAKALKIGVEACSHELIARMDSDDICVSNRFELQLNEFKLNPLLDVVGGYIVEFNDINQKTKIRCVPKNQLDIKNCLPYKAPFNHVTVMFKKSLILKIGNYKDFRGIEDLALWFDVVNSSIHLKNIDDILVRVRVNPGFISRRSGFSYAYQELNVFYYALKMKYISLAKFFLIVSLRVPIRLLPRFLVSILYKLKR